MSYSVGTEWDGTTTTTGDQVGWMGQIWTALSDTATEPDPDNTDWELDTPAQVLGFGIAEIPDPKDYLYVFMAGFGIAAEHISKPDAVNFYGFGMVKFRNAPYLKILID